MAFVETGAERHGDGTADVVDGRGRTGRPAPRRRGQRANRPQILVVLGTDTPTRSAAARAAGAGPRATGTAWVASSSVDMPVEMTSGVPVRAARRSVRHT